MASSHLFRLDLQIPQDVNEGGKRIKADVSNFPILRGMSLYKLFLNPKGIREPHWHPNADELGYCLSGQVLVMFYHTGDVRETFLVESGDTFFIPSGALHSILNVGKERAELILQFSHENVEEFGLSASISAFSPAVLGNTWGVTQDFFHSFQPALAKSFAFLTEEVVAIPEASHFSSPYLYHLESSAPILDRSEGSARMARQNMWPILKKQSLYSLRITNKGMREPHWHPETAEMGYVHRGNARMLVLDPDGTTDTYLLRPGDLYYIPKAYPHHIENVGEEELHFLIFFDQSMPRDIGFTASVLSFPSPALADLLQVNSGWIQGLNKYYTDLFIVEKINPSDPIKEN